jgi:hypothetical protein
MLGNQQAMYEAVEVMIEILLVKFSVITIQQIIYTLDNLRAKGDAAARNLMPTTRQLSISIST